MRPEKVVSSDGTPIAFEKSGKGPALILIGGAFCDRKAAASGTPLAALLAPRFTVYSYDRRGRGDSGDSSPHTLEREVEDLAALIGEAGGSARVFGNSSGGLLALDAAARGLPIAKIIVYEPPVLLDAARAASFADLAKRLSEASEGDRRAEAVELFFTQALQMPAQAVAGMRRSPMWPGLEKLAHTLSHDILLTAQGPARLAKLGAVGAETLAISGDAAPDWMRDGVRALADALPHARHRVLEGQTHDVDPEALAKAIGEFLIG